MTSATTRLVPQSLQGENTGTGRQRDDVWLEDLAQSRSSGFDSSASFSALQGSSAPSSLGTRGTDTDIYQSERNPLRERRISVPLSDRADLELDSAHLFGRTGDLDSENEGHSTDRGRLGHLQQRSYPSHLRQDQMIPLSQGQQQSWGRGRPHSNNGFGYQHKHGKSGNNAGGGGNNGLNGRTSSSGSPMGSWSRKLFLPRMKWFGGVVIFMLIMVLFVTRTPSLHLTKETLLNQEDHPKVPETNAPDTEFSLTPGDSLLTSKLCPSGKASRGKPFLQYAVVVDAGSTGSRIHAYKFVNCAESQAVGPQLDGEVFEMLKGGLSSYEDDPVGAARSLDGLMETAKKSVPQSLWGCTPVVVKATAGLRMLGATKSERILQEVERHLREDFPFPLVSREAVVIMDGADEGVYAWITVNFLLGSIGKTASNPTAAIFDLGGGSTQIVFEPTFAGQADTQGGKLEPGEHRYELNFGGRIYELYQHSYLGYGLMSARKTMHRLVAEDWRSMQKGGNEQPFKTAKIPHPCLPDNISKTVEVDLASGEKEMVTFIGTGAGHAQCRSLVERMLEKSLPCSPSGAGPASASGPSLGSCAFAGVYQPSLSQTFKDPAPIYAFSYFYDRTKPLGMPSSVTLAEIGQLTDQICSGDYKPFAHVPGALEELADRPEWCLDATYIFGLLHIGYDIGLDREVRIAKKIKEVEAGWCLGLAVSIVEEAGWQCRG